MVFELHVNIGTVLTNTEFVRTIFAGAILTGTKKSLHRNYGNDLTAPKRRRRTVVHPIFAQKKASQVEVKIKSLLLDQKYVT